MTEKREQMLNEILNRLEDGVRQVYRSDEWKNYLTVMSKFHTYSCRNSLLIYLQKPDATHVAGYQVWRKEFNRQVRKGEKGIRILAPVKIKAEETVREGEAYVISGFRTACVFDISQTFGDPVPLSLCRVLQGEVKDYPLFIEALLLASPVPVRFEKTAEGIHGLYRPLDEEIIVNPGMSERQTVKTLLHEIAHALLHKDNRSAAHEERIRREVEAESVAYAVSSCFGIDTSSYSFSYIASWAEDQELKRLKESMETIRRASDHLIRLIRTVRDPLPVQSISKTDLSLSARSADLRL